jgi:hypothetical protein
MTTIDWTRPIETADGYRASLLHTLRGAIASAERRIVLFTDRNGAEHILILDDNGKSYEYSPVYIRNVPAPRRNVWVAVQQESLNIAPIQFETRNAAQEYVVRRSAHPYNWSFHEIEIDG